MLRDALTCAKVGALAGLAYVALFSFGASLFKSGIGRGVVLALDWILGDGPGGAALVTPRAHVRSLFGGAGAFDLSQRASTLSLVLIAAFCGALALLLARRQKA